MQLGSKVGAVFLTITPKWGFEGKAKMIDFEWAKGKFLKGAFVILKDLFKRDVVLGSPYLQITGQGQFSKFYRV